MITFEEFQQQIEEYYPNPEKFFLNLKALDYSASEVHFYEAYVEWANRKVIGIYFQTNNRWRVVNFSKKLEGFGDDLQKAHMNPVPYTELSE